VNLFAIALPNTLKKYKYIEVSYERKENPINFIELVVNAFFELDKNFLSTKKLKQLAMQSCYRVWDDEVGTFLLSPHNEEQQKLKLTREKFKLKRDVPLDKKLIEYMYIVQNGNIFVINEKEYGDVNFDARSGYIRHSTLSHQDDVEGAGLVKIKDNNIIHISNESGHYTPPIDIFMQSILTMYDKKLLDDQKEYSFLEIGNGVEGIFFKLHNYFYFGIGKNLFCIDLNLFNFRDSLMRQAIVESPNYFLGKNFYSLKDAMPISNQELEINDDRILLNNLGNQFLEISERIWKTRKFEMKSLIKEAKLFDMFHCDTYFKGGILDEIQMKLLNTKIIQGNTHPHFGQYIYVMDKKGDIYFLSELDDAFEGVDIYHSCFLSGADVSAAGELEITSKGVVSKINNKSGHYRPILKHLFQAVYILINNFNCARQIPLNVYEYPHPRLIDFYVKNELLYISLRDEVLVLDTRNYIWLNKTLQTAA